MKKSIFLVLLAVFAYYAIFWYRYKLSLDEAGRIWYENEYVQKEIEGVIESISYSDNFPPVILIQNKQEEFLITYRTGCVDKDFHKFVSQGDSVFKSSGEKMMKFCKIKQDKCKEFELTFCSEFE